jgi:hypothetical protein
MGPWGCGPNPETDAEKLFHTADKSAARESNDIGIYFPAEELTNEWPDLTVEDVDEGDAI